MQRLESLDWRVDVTLSTSSSQRVLRPSVLLRLVLSDGTVQLLDLDRESFGHLRYTVAELLAEMDSVRSNAAQLQTRLHIPSKVVDPQQNSSVNSS